MDRDLFPVAKEMFEEGWAMVMSDRVMWTKTIEGWKAEVASSNVQGQFRWFVQLDEEDSPIALFTSGETVGLKAAKDIAAPMLQFLSTMPRDMIERIKQAEHDVSEADAHRRDERRESKRSHGRGR